MSITRAQIEAVVLDEWAGATITRVAEAIIDLIEDDVSQQVEDEIENARRAVSDLESALDDISVQDIESAVDSARDFLSVAQDALAALP